MIMKMLFDDIRDRERNSVIIKVIGILALILLIAMTIRGLASDFASANISFTSFLSYMSNAPSVVPTFSIGSWEITADWGIFNFLRDFFNPFMIIFGFGAWVVTMFFRCLGFIFYFARFFFV